MSKSQKKTTEMVIKPSELDLDLLSFSKLETNKNSYGQLTAYPIYNGGKLIMQFPYIALDYYGVPNIDDFHETDKDREYCQVPLDPDVKESADLLEVLKSIDEHLGTPEFKEKYFGDKADKYKLSPCVKVPDVKPGEKTKSGKPKITIPSVKIKISVDYDTGEVDTTFFKPVMVDGEKKRVPFENIKTMTDVKTNVLSYKSKAKFVVAYIKLWAHQPTKKSPEYGVTLKAIKAEVDPAPKSGASLKELKVSDEFLDSDSEEKTVKTTKPIAKIEVEEDDEDDDEEIVAKPVPKVETKITKKVQQIESDDDDDDDEEEEEKPKPAAKQAKKVVVEDDEEEEEVVEKPKPAVIKQAKKVVVEDDDEEEEVVEKPKPAPKKAAAKGKGKTANA